MIDQEELLKQILAEERGEVYIPKTAGDGDRPEDGSTDSADSLAIPSEDFGEDAAGDAPRQLPDIADLRARIDEIDETIISKLAERFRIVEDIAEVKVAQGLPIYNEKREKEILDSIGPKTGNEFGGLIKYIYKLILECSRKLQKRRTENIYLIGMPGCGKSTVGRLVAAKTGRKFVDADDMFFAKYKVTPANCITKLGEAEFRRLETEVLKEIVRYGRCIVALGGGVVKSLENKQLIGSNATIVYIRRDLDKLAVKGRPLSERKGVESLHKERRELYYDWCTFSVVNETIGDAADQIVAKCFS